MGYNQAIACAGSEILEKTGQLQARGMALKGLCLPKQPPEHPSLVHTLILHFSLAAHWKAPVQGPRKFTQELGVSQDSARHWQLCRDQEHSHLYITHQVPLA